MYVKENTTKKRQVRITGGRSRHERNHPSRGYQSAVSAEEKIMHAPKLHKKPKTNSRIQTPAKGKDSTIILIILIHNQLQRIGSFNTPVDDTASSSSSRLLQSDLCQGLYNSEAMEK
jgi:hypothetical protein